MTVHHLLDVPVTARGAEGDAGVRWRLQKTVLKRDDMGVSREIAGIGDIGAWWPRSSIPGDLRLEVMTEWRPGYPKGACDLRLPPEYAFVASAAGGAIVWRIDTDRGGDPHCYALPWPASAGPVRLDWSRSVEWVLLVDLATPGCDPWRMTYTAPPARGLLPPNATALEREVARVVVGRLAALAAPIRELHDPAACPPALLAALAWGRRVEPWDPAAPLAAQRAAIAGSAAAYRLHGTPAADRAALDRLRVPYLYTERPGGAHHRVTISMYTPQQRAADAALAPGILAALAPVRRASVHYDSEPIDPGEMPLAPTVAAAPPVLVAPPAMLDLRPAA